MSVAATEADAARRALAEVMVAHPVIAVAIERVSEGRNHYAKAGDMLAEMLGHALAAMEAGETFGERRMDAARDGILSWHQLRGIFGS